MPRHTHQEFVRFLNAVERAVPAGKIIHCRFALRSDPGFSSRFDPGEVYVPRWMGRVKPVPESRTRDVVGGMPFCCERQSG
jgi:hypothetical protein